MKKDFYHANLYIENRKGGIQPAIFVVENDTVYMIIITPDQQFSVTDEGKLGERYRYGNNGKLEWCDN